MYSYGPLHMAGQKQDVQPELTYSSSMRIRDVALKTCQRQWTIGRSGERGSGISVPVAWHDDDDNYVTWFLKDKSDILSNVRPSIRTPIVPPRLVWFKPNFQELCSTIMCTYVYLCVMAEVFCLQHLGTELSGRFLCLNCSCVVLVRK